MTDSVMDQITAAVTLGRTGDPDTARTELCAIWARIGPTGDAFHRCVLSHYLADLYEDPAEALVWDVRSLDAAAAATDESAQDHHAGLTIAAFYPSLHLNLADNFRRLSSFGAAQEHIDAAREHQSALGDDEYGTLIRRIIDEVAEAIAHRDTTRRETAPGTGVK